MIIKQKRLMPAIILASVAILASISTGFYKLGTRHNKCIAIDFSVSQPEIEESTVKYAFLPAEYSNYICEMSAALEVDSDLVVAILMVENPDFDPNAIHRNDNGTLDVGLFQSNDRYLWTTFKDRYWFDNLELDPFNWKHSTFIALHHIKYLQDKLKVEDSVILAYNGGEYAVMSDDIKPSTYRYLSDVKNNLFLLREIAAKSS